MLCGTQKTKGLLYFLSDPQPNTAVCSPRPVRIVQVAFPEANFLPQQKLKELERYLPATREAEQPESMDDDLYIYADLEDCDPASERRSYYQSMEEDDYP